MIPNQPTLFCRQCWTSYEQYDDRGVCGVCETPNMAHEYLIAFPPIVAWSPEEAIMALQELMAEDIGLVMANMTIEEMNR